MPTRPLFLTRRGRILSGVRKPIVVPNPAVQAEWKQVVPGGVMWRVLGGRATLTTDATVANRFVGAMALSDGKEIFIGSCSSALVASSSATVVYQRAEGNAQPPAYAGVFAVPLPDEWLKEGDVIQSFSVLGGAADVLTNIQLQVEEVWYDNQSLTDEYDLIMDALRKAGGTQ